MKENKKIQLLEIIILLTITMSLIIISIFAIKVLQEKPQTSQTNLIENYSITRIIKYYQDPNLSIKYNLPLSEYINFYESTYETYIISTDNIITNQLEKINISYNYPPEERISEIKNYCNKYDEIETKYKLQCSFKSNILSLKNDYSINKLSSENIKTSLIDVNVPTEKGTLLSNYLTYLDSIGVNYEEISSIN